MKYVWKYLKSVNDILLNGNNLALFLDFDGTLSPIVKMPELAVLPKETKKVIRKLKKNKKTAVIIISGRSMKDIKNKVSIKDLIYSGSHGIEYEVNGKYVNAEVPPESLKALWKIKYRLIRLSEKFEGSLVEDKGFTLAFHYRAVDPSRKQKLKQKLNKALEPYIKQGFLYLIVGKQVYDIRTNNDWTKGHACLLLLNMLRSNTGKPINAVYIGDDVTDEDAFFHMKDGITIRVGQSKKSEAKYYLNDTQEVLNFLIWLGQTLH